MNFSIGAKVKFETTIDGDFNYPNKLYDLKIRQYHSER